MPDWEYECQQTSLAERSSHRADCLTMVILGGFGMGLGEQETG